MANFKIDMVSDHAPRSGASPIQAPRVNAARANGKLILMYFLLDMSVSMTRRLEDGVARYIALVHVLIRWLRNLSEDEMLLDNLCLVIQGFNSNQTITFTAGTLLGDLDIDALEQTLLNAKPSGSTPIGQSVCNALDVIQGMKADWTKAGTPYFQPMLVLLSDDEAGGQDDIAAAAKRVDTLLGKEKLVMLPVGIGNPGTRFPRLSRFIRITGSEAGVITSSDDLRRFFRFLNQTVPAIATGKVKMSSYGDWAANWKRS